jgi:trigger factor
MDIKFENIDKVSAKLTVKVTPEDYQEALDKSLKDFRRKAQLKGFRPGCVPMTIVKKLYGPEAKAEEVSKSVNTAITNYFKENSIAVLGHVLPASEQKEQDYRDGDTFEYVMDVALEPEVKIELGKDDTIAYYDIAADEKFINEKIGEMLVQHGNFEQVDTYQAGDYMKGTLLEVAPAEGNEPLKVEDVLLSPNYFKDEAQKKLFDGAKKDDIVTINPTAVYQNETQTASMLKIKKEELGAHSGDFTYTITEINHRKPAELNQQFFDEVLGKDAVKDEKEFRQKLAEEFNKAQAANSDFKFFDDLRVYALKKAGEMEFSESLLKRLMKENNPDKDDKYIDDNYAGAVEQLKWQLVRDRLALAAEIKIEDKDIREMAQTRTRRQFAAYGMQLPDELVEQYADKSLKEDGHVEELFYEVLGGKLTEAYKQRVTLDHKSVTPQEFENIVKQQNAE